MTAKSEAKHNKGIVKEVYDEICRHALQAAKTPGLLTPTVFALKRGKVLVFPLQWKNPREKVTSITSLKNFLRNTVSPEAVVFVGGAVKRDVGEKGSSKPKDVITASLVSGDTEVLRMWEIGQGRKIKKIFDERSGDAQAYGLFDFTDVVEGTVDYIM